MEAPVSLFSTVLLGKPSGVTELAIMLICKPEQPEPEKGEVLVITDHHHEVDGLEPLLRSATRASMDAPLPYYMAAGQQLPCDVPAGKPITREMIIAPTD